jgi:hypothetical protein
MKELLLYTLVLLLGGMRAARRWLVDGFLSQQPVIRINEFNQLRFVNAGIARS